VKAIATYLKCQPGRAEKSEPAAIAPNDPMMVAGQAIYRDQCAACHMLDGKGVAHLFPSLAESPGVRSSDPASLIRVILRGARSAATAKEPTAPGMPSFAWQLTDEQVAAVTTYIRNAWPPAAAAVSADQVNKARADLQSRTE
jgi:mono/diheme cytochrome c family protein